MIVGQNVLVYEVTSFCLLLPEKKISISVTTVCGDSKKQWTLCQSIYGSFPCFLVTCVIVLKLPLCTVTKHAACTSFDWAFYDHSPFRRTMVCFNGKDMKFSDALNVRM